MSGKALSKADEAISGAKNALRAAQDAISKFEMPSGIADAKKLEFDNSMNNLTDALSGNLKKLEELKGTGISDESLGEIVDLNKKLEDTIKALSDIDSANIDVDAFTDMVDAAKRSADEAGDAVDAQKKIINDGIADALKSNPDAAKSVDEFSDIKKTKWEKMKNAGKKGLKVVIAGGVVTFITMQVLDNMAQEQSGCFDSEGNKVAGYCWCTSAIAEIENGECELKTVGPTKRSICADKYIEQAKIVNSDGATDHPNTECRVDNTQEGTLESMYNTLTASLSGNSNTFDQMLIDNWAGQPSATWTPDAENSEDVRNKDICDGINCGCFDKDTETKIAEFCSCSKIQGHSCNIVTPEQIFSAIVSDAVDTAADGLNCIGGNFDSCQSAFCSAPIIGAGCDALPSFLRPFFIAGTIILILFLLYQLFKSGPRSRYAR